MTTGCGRAQREGGLIEEIRPSDVICLPSGEKHWHGAALTTAMTHIVIQEALDGKVVSGWIKSVTNNTGNESTLSAYQHSQPDTVIYPWAG